LLVIVDAAPSTRHPSISSLFGGMPMADCSIIICTRNRSPKLAETLESFSRVRVPTGWDVEMIIVDNGSTDETAAVIRKAWHPVIRIRHLTENRSGKSRAQNRALREAESDVLLFTDDDVEPADNWIERMAGPLRDGSASAVVGRIILSSELRRPWMTPMHEMWLAAVAEPDDDDPILIGACMGIHRRVFERIGTFDEELGPGAAGCGEETLLWCQIKEAGMRIITVRDTHVVHHPHASRLDRSSWLAASKRYGITDAYVRHHWEHERRTFPRMRSMILRVKLFVRKKFVSRNQNGGEGCPEWELSYLVRLESLRQWRIESRRPRNYERRGLVRIRPNP
jgi:GT2 family glycosyltransferase